MARPTDFLAVEARLWAAVALVAAALPPRAWGQEAPRIHEAGVRLEAGAHYGAGSLHRLLFGTDYRALWTTPIEVRVLDLATFAGGLTPTTAGGRFQTKSLRFRGGDGYAYGFRSVDKDPAVLPPEFSGTFIEDLIKDQTSSQHPAAPAVVAPLSEGAGILHTDPILVVLPDDPRLGPFRERFAGMLGFLERRATIEPDRPGFAGAVEIIDTEELYARAERGPADQVDVPAFLTARLFDMWLGDWDRHRGQWTWARREDGPVRHWIVIPEDRDQAFGRYDGVMLALARLQVPFLLNFNEEYGSVFGATWNGHDLDRRFLTAASPATWDSTVRALVARLTDTVIEAAVRRMPPEMYALDGARLAQTLKARRAALPDFAARYRRLLVHRADLHTTDAAEDVVIDRQPNGTVAIRATERGGTGVPVVRAGFVPSETREIRLYLHAGEDRVVVRGAGSPIALRIVGGGAARIVDSSATGGIRLYATGVDSASRGVHVDRRPTVAPPPRRVYDPWRDWGGRTLANWVVGYAPDLGLTLGGGATRTTYAFRKYPFATEARFVGGMSLGPMRPRAQVDLLWHHENTRRRTALSAGYTGVEILRFHGLGNTTTITEPDVYYRVRQEQIWFAPTLYLALGPRTDVVVGVLGERMRTRADSGRIIAATSPIGTGTYLQAAVRAGVRLDTRDQEAYPTRGVTFRLQGRLYPPVGDVDSTYGVVEAVATTYLTAPSLPLHPTLALRAGGKHVWGVFPFFEAAFIGDAETVRLGRPQRYGGDAAAYGNAELRLKLGHYFVILPGEIGVFGLADAGRVFVDGESSTTWHTAFGGGVWLSILGPRNVVNAAIVRSAERTGVYVGLGMAY